jgi:hypothetical protein
MTDRIETRSDGLLVRLWRYLANFADAVDVSEASLLADRVTAIERRLSEMGQQAMPSPHTAAAPRPSND